MGYTGSISFPGIVEPIYIRSAIRTNGLRPNKCLLVAKPQPNPPSLTGTLSFGFDTTTVAWPNALCDSCTVQVTPSGHQVFWTIMDGRWRHWKAFATKAFNVKLPDGTIDTDTEASLQEIITFLFTAMGATADVSAVTSTETPEIILDHDRAVPELEQILEDRGYVASYQFDGTYKLYRVGSGVTLPNDGDVVNFASSINPPELPRTLRARCGHTLVQSKLKLTAVGLDTDGKVKKVKDLSYNPGGVGAVYGWDGMDLETFNFITDIDAQDLALMTVGKWYQVEFQANGDHNLNAGSVNYSPGEIEIDSPLQYLPLHDYLAQAGVDVWGKARNRPAYVEGTIYADFDNPPKGKNTEPFTRIRRRDWTLNKEMGIVMFREPARMIVDEAVTPKDRVFKFADLYLTCCYSVHDNDTHIKDRYLRDRDLGGTGVDQIPIEELERTLVCKYGPDGKIISSITDNEDDVITLADRYLDNAQASFSTGAGNMIYYRGIRRYTTDGVNFQVAWRAAAPGGVPFSTTVAQGVEAHPLAPKSRDRRYSRQNDRSNVWNTSRGRRYRNAKRGGR